MILLPIKRAENLTLLNVLPNYFFGLSNKIQNMHFCIWYANMITFEFLNLQGGEAKGKKEGRSMDITRAFSQRGTLQRMVLKQSFGSL